MTPAIVVGSISLIVSILLALLAATWRFATLAAELSSDSKGFKESVTELKSELGNVREIPVIKQKLEMFMSTVPGHAQTLGDHEVRLVRVEGDIAHIRERATEYRARHGSFPDLEDHRR